MTTQVLLNGVLAGLTWGLAAVGFTVVYGTVRFLHAAYAATFLIGAYMGIALSQVLDVAPGICTLVAVSSAGLAGFGIEVAIYRPLRRRESSSLILFLASLATLIIVENTVALVFGREIQVASGRWSGRSLEVLGAKFTVVQAGVGVTALALFCVTWLFTRFSSMGKRMRAVACDPELAAIVGIDEKRALAASMIIGSGLSGASGFLLAYDTAVTPTMSFNFLLLAVTAAIIGGVGSIPGAMLGGLLVGIGQHVGAQLTAPKWQDAIVFVILLLFLLFRPYGFFGSPLRKVSV